MPPNNQMTSATSSAPPAPPGDTPLFRAAGLTKYYLEGGRRLDVLQGVDLELHAGEMIAIVGASGTGKTTLLHILGTLDRPSGGALFHQGQNLFLRNEAELSHFRNKTVGFVFQFHHLLPEFTALENVMMPGLIAGLPREQLAAESYELLDKVALGNRLQHRVGDLSGGEQQRVALARAIIMKPALLLADEPTGNLDPATGGKVFELMQEMNRAYALITIMVTHNHELATRMDRTLTLAEGRLHG